MRLSLLRHGIAVEPGSPGYEDDSQRPLTAKGERRMRRAAKGMLALGTSYDELVSSPYLRARQTADIVAQALSLAEGLRLSPTLAPDGNPRELLEELRGDRSATQHIVLVGHEPYLSRLISTLLTGHQNLPVALKKGGLCMLDIETLRFGRCARLAWLLTPRQLRRLA
jgi:phosphohistidine phosphatase